MEKEEEEEEEKRLALIKYDKICNNPHLAGEENTILNDSMR